MTRLLSAILLGLVPSVPIQASFSDRQAAAFLRENCYRCHDAETQKGDFRVDILTGDFTDHKSAEAWVEVRDMINLDEMPPLDEPRPEVEAVDALSEWVADNLRAAERESLANNGRVLLRRLNREEYTNTLTDLLMMEFPVGKSPMDYLPPDGTAEGFDKVSAALLVDPSLMRQYYEVARMVMDQAIVDGEPEFPTQTNRLEFEDIAESGAIRYLVSGLEMQAVEDGLMMLNGTTRSFALLKYEHEGNRTHVTPVNGRYRFTLAAKGMPGKDGTLPRLRVTQSHPDDSKTLLMEFELPATKQPEEYEVVLQRDDLGGELHVTMVNGNGVRMSQRPGEHFRGRNRDQGEAGKFAEVIRLEGRRFAEGWGGDRSTPDPDKLDLEQFPRAFLDYLEVEGPIYESWPPKFQKTYLGKNPPEEGQEMAAAKRAFEQFLPRAWRRLVQPDEMKPLLEIVSTELAHGESFNEAMRVGVTAALTSPNLLYLDEPHQDDDLRDLNEFELASRLSYFLWASMPDEELFQLASQGELSRPETLMAQVDRMMSDQKVERFVRNFGGQWLRTDTFLAFEPNEHLFPEYDDRLERAVVQEPLEFLRTIMRDDASLLNFIDSDFVVVNEPLADHYEIPGVAGDHFRKVPLDENSVRGGLLGMAGVHLAGADGQRTKPVTRAVYVREVLFNDPPDPPPPNAGEIEPNIKGENLTVRERLLEHQKIASCAACHSRLDPYGLALENFNVVGSWREQEDGEGFNRRPNSPKIVASGQLPNGTEFADFPEFRDALRAQENRFRRGIAEKMFTYALGRPVIPGDESALQHATEYMAATDDSLRSLIKAVVASSAFRTK